LARTCIGWCWRRTDRVIGLELDDLAVDGCMTKAPCGGDKAGRSPVDRGKQGLKRSTLTDANGIPLHLVSAGANRHDAPLLRPTLAGLDAVGPLDPACTVHLDRGYAGAATRQTLAEHGVTGIVARTGVPAPLQVGQRWVVERTQAWMNGFGKLRRCTERAGAVVDFYLFLAAALVVVRRLIQAARPRYRWDGRPTARRLT
jgi:transposase